MPNASLSVRGAWLVMGLAFLGTGGCAAYCTWLGFWPVLPFAGLELGLLGWALHHSMQRSRYREVVSLTEDTVRIEFGEAGTGARSKLEMPRYWTRVVLEWVGQGRIKTSRLVLTCSGNRVVIGQFLTDEERKALAARLQWSLRLAPVNKFAGLAASKTLGDG